MLPPRSFGARRRRTLAAAARVLIPPGGALPWGADDLAVADRALRDAEGYPRRVRRQIAAFLTAFEYLPLLSRRPPFTRLGPDEQEAVLRRTYHHRFALLRLIASLMKQLCYTAYLQSPEVEQAVGYRYECARPRAGVDPAEQVHH